MDTIFEQIKNLQAKEQAIALIMYEKGRTDMQKEIENQIMQDIDDQAKSEEI